MKSLIVATDNRFWLNRLGSNSRILTLVQHLQAQGWQVQVAFMGHGYPFDGAACDKLALQMQHSLPALPMPAADAAQAGPGRLSWRQRLSQGRRWLRAAATQFAHPRAAGGWWRTVALRAQARTAAEHHDPRHVALLQRMCRQARPRAVIVEFVHLAWLAQVVPQGVLRLIDTHDVQHERQQRFQAAGEPHWLDITAAEEARLLSAFDTVIAIQQRDAGLLSQLVTHRRVITVMHPQALQAPQAPAGAGLHVGFVGSQMAPNELAARELLQHIWPMVHAGTGGSARLQIIGSVCQSLAGTPLPAGAELLGFVDDLDSVYGRLAVLVNPVRLGGGLKIKNVEALCRSKPLVTTTLGAEGLEDGSGLAFVVADSTEEFGAQVLALLQDPARRQALAEQAHEFARRQFDAQTVYAPLDAALSATLPPEGSG